MSAAAVPAVVVAVVAVLAAVMPAVISSHGGASCQAGDSVLQVGMTVAGLAAVDEAAVSAMDEFVVDSQLCFFALHRPDSVAAVSVEAACVVAVVVVVAGQAGGRRQSSNTPVQYWLYKVRHSH